MEIEKSIKLEIAQIFAMYGDNPAIFMDTLELHSMECYLHGLEKGLELFNLESDRKSESND